MKSWIAFLLPEDEYKKSRLLYFYSEGAIILILSLIAMIVYNKYFILEVDIALMLSIVIFLFYVTARYILSGMEYTDVATEKIYKKELRALSVKVATFFIIFMSIYLVWEGIPTSVGGWTNVFGVVLSASILWFFVSFISLKRSYKKNKDLL